MAFFFSFLQHHEKGSICSRSRKQGEREERERARAKARQVWGQKQKENVYVCKCQIEFKIPENQPAVFSKPKRKKKNQRHLEKSKKQILKMKPYHWPIQQTHIPGMTGHPGRFPQSQLKCLQRSLSTVSGSHPNICRVRDEGKRGRWGLGRPCLRNVSPPPRPGDGQCVFCKSWVHGSRIIRACLGPSLTRQLRFQLNCRCSDRNGLPSLLRVGLDFLAYCTVQ